MVTTGLVHVAGEVTTEAYVEIPGIVREHDPRDRLRLLGQGLRRRLLRRVGLDRRSSRPDIAQGVDNAYEHRAGGASTRSTSRAPATRA